jgi:diaminopimelate epimerase
MTIPFYKYQGTGNDFVMIDQRETQYLTRADTKIVHQLCDRRFGIGADGLILLQNTVEVRNLEEGVKGYDFEMIYFNADGSESTMCGNGGRCIVAFAQFLKIFDKECVFKAIDGAHDAKISENGWVELKMIDVKNLEIGNDYFLMNTGSPHYVVFTEDLTDINVYENGRAIRYSDRFAKEGVNVNFVEIRKDGGIEVATYERGVEDETFSCGTGVTAAAIAYYVKNEQFERVPIKTKGGDLEVRFHKNIVQNMVRTLHQAESMTEGVFENVWLCGPATQVFSGEVNLPDDK